MRGIKCFILIFIVTSFGQACATSNCPSIGAQEVADAAGLHDTAVRSGTVSHMNLCVQKECEGQALAYTQFFRRAAIVSEAVEAIDNRATEAVLIGDGPSQRLYDASQRLGELKHELKALQTRIESKHPGLDFAEPARQLAAIEGLEETYRKLARARTVAHRADQVLDRILAVEQTSALVPSDIVHIEWEVRDTSMNLASQKVRESIPTSIGTVVDEAGPATARR